MRLQTTMSEATGRFWTVIFGGVTALSLVAGGIYTPNQYLQNKEAEQRNRQNEARNYALQLGNAQLEIKRPFFAKQLELCNELTETAATLAVLTSKKQKERDQAWTRYYVLYFGPLRMFAGKAVFLAANEFAQCLEVPCPDKSTWDLATQIASSCRAELAENWNIKLPPLDEPNKGKK